MKNRNLLEVDKYLSVLTNFDFLKSLDVDDALDSRDEPGFDDQWMTVFKSLESKTFKTDDISFVDMLREKAFKQSFKVINNSEISSRISDDFEIIAKSFIAGDDNNWAITYLWMSYKNKKFPE
ncbi:hypothetical protein COO59_04810 [Mixta theicola]|uniref:Uncharacterized protein n=1 Tax=Mixta theicola TaxID=1458355 RepID=A0A2K1QDW8_9GAMM|nr:hypothetical protein [Mixta theicola]PNS13224.1 hypothetical protein COO59_04810 [Mixta theicola]GLR09511.1 hypothetical protein GCM10007905_22310 [Mixta theicola]